VIDQNVAQARAVSGSRIGGRYVIRVACSNHRSTWDDFEAFLAGVERMRDNVLRG
jgi:hypothetical protein